MKFSLRNPCKEAQCGGAHCCASAEDAETGISYVNPTAEDAETGMSCLNSTAVDAEIGISWGQPTQCFEGLRNCKPMLVADETPFVLGHCSHVSVGNRDP